MNEISIDKIIKNINSINLIDIRSIESFNNNHIPGAKNIPMESLLISPNMYLKKDERYYIYCQKGISSKKICNILKNLGYDVYSIIGGYESWILEK
ncbi:MAG: rhodanese-like domain-containing protein [Bacilli bacterium]|nr:rhodanese-like domain-containing protein [Bacilli bacterium]